MKKSVLLLSCALDAVAFSATNGLDLVGANRVKVTSGATVAEFDVAPAEVVAVKGERHAALPLWDEETPLFCRGMPLDGVRAMECTASDALVVDSVTVRGADGATLVEGRDWKLNGKWGRIARLGKGRIGKDEVISVDYRWRKMRLDEIVRGTDGSLRLVRGEGAAAHPKRGECRPGESVVARIWVHGRGDGLTDDCLFPVVEESCPAAPDASGRPAAERLTPRVWKKLKAGECIRILAWGDSVTDASHVRRDERWPERFVARLKARFPEARIDLRVVAWPAHDTRRFLKEPPGSAYNYRENVLESKPDLVVSEFVNDSYFGEVETSRLYDGFFRDFRARGIEWIVIAPHYVRNDWMGLLSPRCCEDDPRPYVRFLRRFAAENGLALADVSRQYGRLYRRGIPHETLLVNGVNHPDAFGLGIFADALMELFEIPPTGETSERLEPWRGPAQAIGLDAERLKEVLQFGANESKTWPVAGRLPQTVDVAARLAMRPVTDSHFSFVFLGANGNRLTVYSSGRGVFLISREDGRESERKDLPVPVDFLDCTWKHMRFQIDEKGVHCMIDGKRAFYRPISLGGLVGLRLQNYRLPFEVHSLSVAARSEGRSDFTDAPVVAGDWKVESDERLSVEGALRNRAGAVMFWFSSDQAKFMGPLFRLQDASGRDLVRGDLDFSGFCATFAVPGGEPLTYRLNNLTENWAEPGTSSHFALVWNGADVRLYYNGSPCVPYDGYYNPESPPLPEKDVERATALVLRRGDFKSLKVFRRQVSNADVWREYRSVMPVDAVMQTQMFEAGRPFAPVVQIAPGGHWQVPAPVDEPSRATGLEVNFTLKPKGASQAPLFAERRVLDVTAPLEVTLPSVTLGAGHYLLRAEFRAKGVSRPYVRTFPLTVAPYPKAPARSDDDLAKGALLWERRLDVPDDASVLRSGSLVRRMLGETPYLETGLNRHERFSFEVGFPKETWGKPVLVEIDWPDDKPRMAGIYMYVPSKGYCDRDRLQQGLQSGREYPLSGRIRTERYVFWPGAAEYLFEFRTLYGGMPAAAAAVRAYAVDGPLPALGVREPEGFPARRFGFYDEDQTWYTNMNQDWFNAVAGKTELNFDTFFTREMVNYFAYVGMNSYHAPVLRYSAPLYATEGKTAWFMPPRKVGGFNWFVRALGENGIAFTPIANFWGLPELRTAAVCDRAKRYADWCLGDEDGKPMVSPHGAVPNLAVHAEAQAAYLRHVVRAARVFKDERNVRAFQFDCSPWLALECGYDDFTVSAFERECGVKVPPKDRMAFLTSPEMKPKWTAWRCEKTTSLVRRLRDAVTEVRPDWIVLWTVRDNGSVPRRPRPVFPEDPDWGRDRKRIWRECGGVDVDALNAIPGVYAFRQNLEGAGRWELHMKNHDTAIEEFETDFRGVRDAFRVPGRPSPYAEIYMIYFENMELKKTLMPEKYSSFFQDADVKPSGRFWLKPLVFAVATQDALETTIGAQPFGTIGREAEAREFARAFRALPALPFEDVKGAEDPVTVRFLKTDAGTYFYLANVCPGDVSVRLTWNGPVPTAVDLSSGQEVRADVLSVRPYGLRSFRTIGGPARIAAASGTADAATRAYLADVARKERAALQRLRTATGEAYARESGLLDRMDAELADGHCAEVHRLQQSLVLRRLVSLSETAADAADRKRLMEKGRIAVNCGSDSFFRSRDGRLFFPDVPWSETAGYGYLGTASLTVQRDVSALGQTPCADLYREERYDFDGYRFKVPCGRYALRLYLRWGYAPEFRPGELVVSATANGKTVLRDFDYYAASGGDMNRPLVVETKDIEVKDGFIDFKMFPTKGSRSSVRALVGIEVERQ